MTQEENASPWKKKEAQESLRDDRKRPWDRHEDRINRERANTSKHDARVEKIAEQNTNWVHKNFQPVAAGGTKLPPVLAKMRVDSGVGRPAPKAAPLNVSVESVAETLAALTRDWKTNSANGKLLYTLYEDNAWTREQLNNIMQSLIQQGHPVNAALPEKTFQIAYAGNHLDPRKRTDRAGNIVRLRGEARRPAPVPFPKTIWPDEQAAIEQEQQQKALAESAIETARARSLPFNELKSEATKNRKSEPAQMGPVW
jgi:hypothetical protein